MLRKRYCLKPGRFALKRGVISLLLKPKGFDFFSCLCAEKDTFISETVMEDFKDFVDSSPPQIMCDILAIL